MYMKLMNWFCYPREQTYKNHFKPKLQLNKICNLEHFSKNVAIWYLIKFYFSESYKSQNNSQLSCCYHINYCTHAMFRNPTTTLLGFWTTVCSWRLYSGSWRLYLVHEGYIWLMKVIFRPEYFCWLKS